MFYDIDEAMKEPHHPAMNGIVDSLCHKTGNVNRDFFQAVTAYFLALIPSSLRTMIDSPERGLIPVNVYAIDMATSGFGKGHSVSLLEDMIYDFREAYSSVLLPDYSHKSLYKMAVDISTTKNSDPDEEMEALEAEYKRCGAPLFMFDSGTAPALKQMRHAMLLSGLGAANFQMDEVGSNLSANIEMTNAFLELYDKGVIRTKLVKNSSDNQRGGDLTGMTPANMLLFGTMSKVFDGSRIEEEFISLLETGYARRSFFGIGKPEQVKISEDPADVYRNLISQSKSQALEDWKHKLAKFADERYIGRTLTVSDEVGIELVAYRLQCEQIAAEMPEHDVIRKAEMSHRYFKTLKLAGVYAFLDDSIKLTSQNLKQAMRVTEESGKSFDTLMTRERNFARLAKFLAAKDEELTHADMVEDLPFYPNSTAPRREMMDLACAWGVKNNVLITKNIVSGVEFFSGSSLEETNLNEMMFSVSDHFAYNYETMKVPFRKLPQMFGKPGLHWCNHSFVDGHRNNENTIDGFNLMVADVDGGVDIDMTHEWLRDYNFITYTTKSHTDDDHRFRLVMPTNYILNLSQDDYKEFMNNFLQWLPFESDPGANQRSKKWQTFGNAQVFHNKGNKVLDVLPFVPKTRLNSDYVAGIKDLGNLDNLERWFITQINQGSTRNNTLLNYAMMLKDSGMPFNELRQKLFSLNSRLPDPLKKSELEETVLVTVGKAYSKME